MPSPSQEIEGFDQIQHEYEVAEAKLIAILIKRCNDIMERCSLKEFIIDGIDPLTESSISTGNYTDAVTKITADGEYWFTPNGHRSSEQHGGKLSELPVTALQEIRQQLEIELQIQSVKNES